MAENVHIFDNADKVPPSPPGRHPLAPISGADFERPARRTPWQLWALLLAVLVLPLAWLLWRVNLALDGFFQRYDWVGDVLMWLSVIGVGCVLVGVTIGVVGRVLLGVQKARVIRTRHGVPVDVIQQLRHDPVFLEHQAVVLEMLRAQYSQYPNLSTLSGATASKGEAVPALPAPLQAAADTLWRSWLLEAPHLLISGPSGSGKTTLAKALLADVSASSNLLILDPHDAADKWPLPAIGGGRDYAAIYRTICDLLMEMDSRFKLLQQGVQTFTPITVLIDEAPAVALYDSKQWTFLASRLTSEARKIGIRLLILGQSHLVRDLGLSSLVRRNLGLVGLGMQALDLVMEEREPKRRSQLLDLVRGNGYTAAYSYRAQIEVLDVGNVPQLAAKPLTARPWEPSVCLENRLDDQGGEGNVQTDRRTDGGQDDADMLRESLIIGLKKAGRNREQIRQELQGMGLALDNNEYRLILAKYSLS